MVFASIRMPCKVLCNFPLLQQRLGRLVTHTFSCLESLATVVLWSMAEDAVRREADESLLLEGKYANFFKVGYNAYEFILEFGQLYQSENSPRIHSRIITPPAYARELLETLAAAIRRHEQGDTGQPDLHDPTKPS